MRLLMIGMTALSLAACSGPSENAAQAPANDAVAVDAAANAGNAVDTAIANLSDLQRQGVMLGAIRDANIPCRDVTEVEQVEPTDGKATWRAKCEEGDYHLIVVAPDGNAQVVSRTGG